MVATGVPNKIIHGCKADIWAAGMTLYSIITKTQPFAKVFSPMDLAEKIN